MPIPDYQSIMLPLLKFISDEKEHSSNEAILNMISYFNLTDEEKDLQVPSGHQTYISNRTHWAKAYLKKAKLLETTKRGYFIITQKGSDLLKSDLTELTKKKLMEIDDFKEFIDKSNLKPQQEIHNIQISTPDESIDISFREIISSLADDLIEKIKSLNPKFFEKLVVELLVKMGYGGSEIEASQVIGGSGDEGIDGLIKEDRLGLDVIYIQAKRWQGSVGRPIVQQFSGALAGKRARKGILMTTSNFTKDAIEYANSVEQKIILIDGEKLAEFMIEFNVGVNTIKTYEIKRIDSDYFAEDF